MLHESVAEQQPARLVHLLARFRLAIEAQGRRDAELEAGLARVLRRPRIRRAIKQICEEHER
jgi:hypothetical protein